MTLNGALICDVLCVKFHNGLLLFEKLKTCIGNVTAEGNLYVYCTLPQASGLLQLSSGHKKKHSC